MHQSQPASTRFLPEDLMGNPAYCISATVSTIIERRPADTFDWFVELDISRVLNGYGPLPAVEQTLNQSGRWTTPGETRDLQMSRGITARQEILICEKPRFFAYRVSGFAHILDLMAWGAEARWWFEEVSDGRTRLTWRYTFWPRSRIAQIAMYPIISTIWTGYMQKTIELMRRFAESDAPAVDGHANTSGHG